MESKGIQNRVGSVVRGKDFFGREKFVEYFWERLKNGNILLAAPRRFGKTSVLYALKDNPAENTKVVHADLEAVEEPSDMIIMLLESLAKAEGFETTAGKLSAKFKELWSAIRNAVEEVNVYVVKLKLRDEIRKDWQSSGKEIFEKLVEQDANVVFIMDEFPMMLDAMIKADRKADAKSLLRWFRALRQSPEFQDKIRFVIAGSIGIEHILRQLDEVASVNDFEKISLKPFSQKTALEFLSELSSSYKLPLSDEIKAKIIDLIGTPIPFFIQVFFSKIYEACVLDDAELSESLVKKIYHDKILGNDGKIHFEHYYGRLRLYYQPNEEKATKRMLRDLALSENLSKSDCFRLYETVIGKKADLERFGALMTELENDFYITFNPGKDAYEFGSKLLRDWWLRHYGMTVD